MNGFWKSVAEEPAPDGTAVLWWLGQMGLVIKTGGSVLCIDQYASASPERAGPAALKREMAMFWAWVLMRAILCSMVATMVS